jgi:prevent-host-death family protein
MYSDMEKVTATDAARRFSDLVNRVFYRHESFVIVRNGQEVGKLVPPDPAPTATFSQLVAIVRSHRLDGDFAGDLLAIRAAQPRLPQDPWES